MKNNGHECEYEQCKEWIPVEIFEFTDPVPGNLQVVGVVIAMIVGVGILIVAAAKLFKILIN